MLLQTSIQEELQDEPAVQEFDAIIEQSQNERLRGGPGGGRGFGGRGGEF